MNPAIPLSAPDITAAEIEAVTAVLLTNRLSLGPELEAFEDALARFHSVPHAVAVSSGTAGLHLALLALGIGEGCEVIVPSFAFIAVANSVMQVGATPVFVDIDPVTLNLDPQLVERAISPHTRAILVVHTFGVPAEVDRLAEIANTHRLALIEDSCEALGAEFASRRVGSFGDCAVFGFYPNKQITTGEGGAILTHDPARAARLRSLRNQGRIPGAGWLDHAEVGFNYRLSEMACALGRIQLGRITEILALRRAAAERYDALLAGIPRLDRPALTLPRRTISWFVYVVRLAAGSPQEAEILRDRVQTTLAAEGVATARYFAPVHMQPAWRNTLHAKNGHLPVTESAATRVLALPFFNRITAAQQELVAKSLSKAISRL